MFPWNIFQASQDWTDFQVRFTNIICPLALSGTGLNFEKKEGRLKGVGAQGSEYVVCWPLTPTLHGV